MKIQCDVCNQEEASVFCYADEAALCDACDHRVHHANKLAGKHNRFSLLLPSPNNFPLCDICQEKRAFLFCQQDRAVLCKDFDVPIHKANEHTLNHNRFLLTGLKLSPTSSLYSSSSSSLSLSSSIDVVPHLVPSTKSSLINKSANDSPPTVAKIRTSSTSQYLMNGTSSISEYLIETLPGWHVEDFLDSSSPPKSGERELTSFWDADVEGSLRSSENMGILVPQAPPLHIQTSSSHQPESSNRATNNSRKRIDISGCFNVPEITTTTSSKRSTTSWYQYY